MITCVDLSGPRKFLQTKFDDVMFEYKMLPKEKQNQIKTAVKISSTAFFITVTYACPVHAASALTLKVMKAFQPIVDLMQALGYPAAVCSMTAGGVTMMFNKKLGIRIIKDTAIAYLIIQFIPYLLAILTDVGSTLK